MTSIGAVCFCFRQFSDNFVSPLDFGEGGGLRGSWRSVNPSPRWLMMKINLCSCLGWQTWSNGRGRASPDCLLWWAVDSRLCYFTHISPEPFNLHTQYYFPFSSISIILLNLLLSQDQARVFAGLLFQLTSGQYWRRIITCESLLLYCWLKERHK